MPDSNPVAPAPESSSSAPPAISPDGQMTMSLAAFMSLLAGGLIITFFMPWIQVLFMKASGFDFAKDGGGGVLLWAIPFFAGFTILAGVTGKDQKIAGLLAGFTPICVLLWGIYKEGSGIFDVLQTGAWIGLGLSALLIIIAARK